MRFTRASRPRVTSRIFQRTTIYPYIGTEFSIFGGVYRTSRVGVWSASAGSDALVENRRRNGSNKKQVQGDAGDDDGLFGRSGRFWDNGNWMKNPPREWRSSSNECS